ncbi:MAG: glycosyltransferase family 2 protein [Candidatus Hydrogenedentota bacterium]
MNVCTQSFKRVRNLNEEVKISVVVPTYNYAKFLPQCIQSVINQTFKDWELIIVDDGSTDNTEEIVKKIIKKNKKYRIYYYKINGPSGTSVPLNYGIRKARGKYIAWLSADDYFEPEKLKIQYEFMSKNTEYDMCHTWANIVDDNGKIIQVYKPEINKNQYLQLLVQECIIHGSTVLIKKVAVKENNFFIDKSKSIPDIWRVNDYYMWLTLAARDRKIGLIRKVLHNGRHHEGNRYYNISAVSKILKQIAVRMIYKKYRRYIKKEKHKFYNRNIVNQYEIIELFKFNILNLIFNTAIKYVYYFKNRNKNIYYLLLSIYYHYQGNYEKSIKCLKKSNRIICPPFTEVIESLKKLYLQLSINKERADYQLLELLGLKINKFDEINRCYSIASLLKNYNFYKEAIQLFRHVLSIGTDKREVYHAGAYFHLGDIFLKLNLKKQSRDHFYKCLLINPAHKKARKYINIKN